jgi:hypothetical protein
MAAEFFPRVPSCHHHHLLSFRSTSIFKTTQERGKRRREGWKGTDGAALVSLSGPLQKCAWEGEHEKGEMLFDSEWGWKFGTGEVDFGARGHGPGWRITPQAYP